MDESKVFIISDKPDEEAPKEVKSRFDAMAQKEEIYEPKYGGKDHSGYGTMMLYEVNDERFDCFQRGCWYGWNTRFSEVQTLKIELWHRDDIIADNNRSDAIGFAKFLRLAEWQDGTKILFKNGEYDKLYEIYKSPAK